MSEEYMDIKVYNGDDETKYIKYDDMINLIAKIKIKQDEKDKEIERLNNIINELEEELERESNIKEEDTGLEHNTFIDIRNTLKTVLKRLQELKGSDKE